MRISDWSSDVCSSDLAIGSVAVPCPPGSIGGRIARGEGFVACLVDAIPVASRRVAHAAGAGRTGLVEIIAVGLALGKGGGVADGRLAAIPPQRDKIGRAHV